MAYIPYYSSGWLNGETGATPITPAALNHMEEGIENATSVAESALPKSGGTVTGIIKLTSGVHYGDSLPSAGNAGRIFFKKVT